MNFLHLQKCSVGDFTVCYSRLLYHYPKHSLPHFSFKEAALLLIVSSSQRGRVMLSCGCPGSDMNSQRPMVTTTPHLRHLRPSSYHHLSSPNAHSTQTLSTIFLHKTLTPSPAQVHHAFFVSKPLWKERSSLSLISAHSISPSRRKAHCSPQAATTTSSQPQAPV